MKHENWIILVFKGLAFTQYSFLKAKNDSVASSYID